MKRAVFLDRDGTLIEDKDYLHRPEEVVIFPGTAAALRRLREAGFMLFIVTNPRRGRRSMSSWIGDAHITDRPYL